jgi:endonuclease YncB( thermonuclease family)
MTILGQRWYRCVAAALVTLLAVGVLCTQARAASRTFSVPCIPAQAQPVCFAEEGTVVAVDDGDTIDVYIPGAGTHRVRFTGINATEQTVYNSHLGRQQGECHALNANYLLTRLIERSHDRVRLLYQNRLTRAGVRLVRNVQVFLNGSWHDSGNLLASRGQALFLASQREFAWNRQYNYLTQQAAHRGIGLFDTTFCGFGPDQDLEIGLSAHPNAAGDDSINVNGEWVRIGNHGPRPLDLSGWWVRNSATRRYHFPTGTVIAPGERITVHVGKGTDTPNTLYWGLRSPIFVNPTHDARAIGGGAYLFDPQGDLRAWDFYPCIYNPCPNSPAA